LEMIAYFHLLFFGTIITTGPYHRGSNKLRKRGSDMIESSCNFAMHTLFKSFLLICQLGEAFKSMYWNTSQLTTLI
jgi:hypothetical protein